MTYCKLRTHVAGVLARAVSAHSACRSHRACLEANGPAALFCLYCVQVVCKRDPCAVSSGYAFYYQRSYLMYSWHGGICTLLTHGLHDFTALTPFTAVYITFFQE
jgi:hypothetical protein